jgi:hypothetical protein
MSDFLVLLLGTIASILALILAFQNIAGNRIQTQPPPPLGTTPDATPLGNGTAAALLAMFQDFYRQEVAAEEDVHRTLPFFATALGVIVAFLSYVASQLPDWATVLKTCAADHKTFDRSVIPCAWHVELAGLLILISTMTTIGVLLFLALATRRRGYERVGPEDAHLDRARALTVYYIGRDLEPGIQDKTVLADFREQLVQDFATALPYNRNLTLRRYEFRARAVAYLLWSLFTALLATIIIVATAKFGLLAKGLP